MQLYTYYRSTASFRVRIALALKGIAWRPIAVNLARNGKEQHSAAYRAINPQERVPSLLLNDGTALIQSPAILEYLEEVFPEPPLLPSSPLERAKVRAVAAIIGCDVHPLNNVSPLDYLRQRLGGDKIAVSNWIAEWIHFGFRAVEKLIEEDGYCFGPVPTLADVYLIPPNLFRPAFRCSTRRLSADSKGGGRGFSAPGVRIRLSLNANRFAVVSNRRQGIRRRRVTDLIKCTVNRL